MLITTPTEKSEEEIVEPPIFGTEDLISKIKQLNKFQNLEKAMKDKAPKVIESAEYTSKTNTETSIPKILFSKTGKVQNKYTKGIRKVNKVSEKV